MQEKHCAPAFVGLWKIPTGFLLEVLLFYFISDAPTSNRKSLLKLNISICLFFILCQLFYLVSVRGDFYRSCKRSQGGNWGKYFVADIFS